MKKQRDEVNYYFSNLTGSAVWQWISNFTPRFIGHVISCSIVDHTLKYDTHHKTRVMGVTVM